MISPMEKVLGIGGVFFRARDRKALARWYRDHLGLPVDEEWCMAVLPLEHPDDRESARTVWSAFAHDTDYFGRPENAFMVNYRVRDLRAMLDQLRAAGCDVDDRTEESELGKFGWVTDPEGNRVELWEPPDQVPQPPQD